MVDLSDLPREITDVILSYLPLQEAVRTSILSKKWRHRWTTVRDLVFDADCCPHRFIFTVSRCDPPCDVSRTAMSKLVSSINHVLLFHAGPIRVFSAEAVPPVPDIDSWILHISRSSVRHLRLGINNKKYELPPSFYDCERLTHLHLCGCSLKAAPLSFKGFRSLKSLDLASIALPDDAFKRLTSNCPLLEKLSLTDFDGLQCLKIDAPNLQYVRLAGDDFQDIRFDSVHAKLANISVGHSWVELGKTNIPTALGQFFVNLPGIEQLEICENFLKNLVAASFPSETLPTTFLCLHYLSISIRLDDHQQACAALCLFRSSPNLRKLRIERQISLSTVENPSRWLDEVVSSNCTFHELRSVDVAPLRKCRSDLEFITFVLLNSPALEKMSITSLFLDATGVEHLLRLPRASPSAEVTVYAPRRRSPNP